MTATKEVGEAITAIQSGAEDSTDAMDQTAALVTRAVELAEQSGATLQEIVGVSLSSAEQVRGIAAASEQQSAASEQITRATEEVSRAAEESADFLARSTRSMDTLNVLSADLRDIVRELRA